MLTIIEALRDIGVEVSEGRQTQIHCPFHGQDINPSARVYPEDNSWYCWACHRSYSPITTLAKFHEIDIPLAISMVREKYGPTLPKTGGPNIRQRLDSALAELLSCIHTLPETDKDKALEEADIILSSSARGGNETLIIKSIENTFTNLWPRITGQNE